MLLHALGHQRPGQRLRAVPVQRAHARPHAAGDGHPRAAGPEPRRSRWRCAPIAEARRRHPRGVREWLLLRRALPKVAGVLTHPLVAGVAVRGCRSGCSITRPIFRWATEDHIGHTWMVVHFLLTGFLFAQVAGRHRPDGRSGRPIPLRLILLLATMAMHAFFGLSLVDRRPASCWPTGTGRWDGPGGLAPLAGPAEREAGSRGASARSRPSILAVLVADDVEPQRRPRREAWQDRARRTATTTPNSKAYNAMLEKQGRSG